MIKTISADKLEFLRNEVVIWEEANILDRERGRLLVQQYMPPDKNISLASILSLSGAVLLGLSMIASVAANSISTSGKMAVFVVALALFAVAFVLAWQRADKPNERGQSETWSTLACAMYASAIATVTQLFHYSSCYDWETLVFAFGCACMALTTRSQAATFVCNLAVLTWVSMAQSSPVEYRFLACTAALSLAYHFRNRWALALALVALSSPLIASSANNMFAFPIFSGTLLAWHAWHLQSKSLRSMAVPYLVTGLTFANVPAAFHSFASETPLISLWSVAFMAVMTILSTVKTSTHRVRAGIYAALTVSGLTVVSQVDPVTINQAAHFIYPSDPAQLLPLFGQGICALSFIYCACASHNRWLLSIPLLAISTACYRYMDDGHYEQASIECLLVGTVAMLAALLLRKSESLNASPRNILGNC